MNSNLQAAESEKYLLTPLCLYPHADGSFTLFSGFHARQRLTHLTAEYLPQYLREQYNEAMAEHKAHLTNRRLQDEASLSLLSELNL